MLKRIKVSILSLSLVSAFSFASSSFASSSLESSTTNPSLYSSNILDSNSSDINSSDTSVVNLPETNTSDSNSSDINSSDTSVVNLPETNTSDPAPSNSTPISEADENKAELAANGSWNLYGTPSESCNCMYVTSQGDITLSPVTQKVRFSGYASTVWSGGYADGVAMKIWAKTLVTYVNNSSTNSTPHELTQTKDGTNQTLVSVNIDDTYSSYNLWSATVQTNGWVDFDGNYFQAVGVGNNGI
ncbi:hypothetical protein [Paenibacillus sp. Y412MC10]|uniref:hypothetical protein n=1 Tax=Geobacillus sp. (strain Y412MC10) TaxID=481743 RepID=UPI0011A418E1|nr:hypothetical protein [Paenibacillus sp. Y412MC10]